MAALSLEEAVCYRKAIIALSDHPRWMFRKNSIEFFVGLQHYLYYYYSSCTLSPTITCPFQNVL